MAEAAFLPSPLLLGKKRSMMDDGDGMVLDEPTYINGESGNRVNGFYPPSFKKSRTQNHHHTFYSKPEGKGFTYNNSMNGGTFNFSTLQKNNLLGRSARSSPLSSLHINKMRKTDENEDQFSTLTGFEADEQKFVSNSLGNGKCIGTGDNNIDFSNDVAIVAFKEEYARALSLKDSENERLTAENKSLREQNRNISEDLQKEKQTVEENKILKRAVAIQDSRYKELQTQLAQHQHLLTAAVDHINHLESTNRELTSQIQALQFDSSSHMFPPYPPPDVY